MVSSFIKLLTLRAARTTRTLTTLPSYERRIPRNLGVHLVKENQCYIVVKKKNVFDRVLDTGIHKVNPQNERIAKVYDLGLNHIYQDKEIRQQTQIPAFFLTFKVITNDDSSCLCCI